MYYELLVEIFDNRVQEFFAFSRLSGELRQSGVRRLASVGIMIIPEHFQHALQGTEDNAGVGDLGLQARVVHSHAINPRRQLGRQTRRTVHDGERDPHVDDGVVRIVSSQQHERLGS